MKNKKLQVTSYKLQDRICFLGHVPHAELFQYYSISDVFVRPSLSEGMGNSFIEAMAAGVPIIGTAVGGITDFLKDRETGFVCKVKDPESIAEQVKFIISPQNASAVDLVAKNARILVEGKYDWDKIAGDMKNIFERFA